MPDNIRVAVSMVRPFVDGAGWRDKLHKLIGRYANATLYNRPASEIRKLQHQIARLYAKDIIKQANAVGIKSASPILNQLGGKDLVTKGSMVRGRALATLKRYSGANIDVFNAELAKEIGGLSGEVKAAFSRATRDGIKRQQLIRDLVTSDKAEMKAMGIAYKRVDTARTDLADKLKTGNTNTVKAAQKELRKAKTSVKAVASFVARFEKKVQGHYRDTLRREVAAAQKASFETALGKGVERIWITVNGSAACPDCSPLHGLKVPSETGGEPGGGQTVCGASCMCQTIPAAYSADKKIDSPITV